MSKLYHFAYGASMNREQLQRCGCNPEAIAVAKLADHRIAFFGYSRIWDGAVETVVEAPGEDVWGVVYALNTIDREKLDAWQDVRIDGTGAYFHFPAVVTDTEGKSHTVLLYKKDILGDPQKPSREYLDCIVRGASERGLPSGYVEELQRLESRKATYGVPRYRKMENGFLPGSSCSGCGA